MSLRLDFAELVHYDAGQPGITLPVTLGLGKTQVECDYEGALYLGPYGDT